MVNETRPGWGGTDVIVASEYYANGVQGAGHLKSVTTTAGTQLVAPTRYEHDELGNLYRTGLDLGDEGLDPNASDRFTETETLFEDRSGVLWQTTTTRTYDDDHESVTLSTIDRRLTLDTYQHQLAEVWTTDAAGAVTTVETRYQNLLSEPQDYVSPKYVEELTTYADGSTSQQITYNNLLQSHTTPAGAIWRYAYDGLGRQTRATDPRSGPTFTEYNNYGVAAVYKTSNDQPGGTRISETAHEYDAASGRLAAVRTLNFTGSPPTAAYKYTRYGYTSRGEIQHIWGDVPQPVKMQYNTLGERTKLTTYRGGEGNTWTGTTWPASPPAGDTTQWTYAPATGLLSSKEDAANKQVTYSYTPHGRLLTRTWARGVVTTYAYDPNTADLTDISYSDSTTGVEFEYDRLGRVKQVTDAVGTRDITYLDGTRLSQTETYGSGSMFAGRVVTWDYDPREPGTHPGRFAGVQVATVQQPPVIDYAATYSYDAIGRLARVTGPGLPAGTGADYGAHYAYLPQTTLVGQVDIRDESANVRLRTVRAYEPNRDLIDYVENVWRPNGTPATISKYEYTSDALGRRTNVDYTGVAFGSPQPPIGQPFGYNDRNELISSSRGTGSWAFNYDPIGNRRTYTTEGAVTTTYTSNVLNQYERWDRPGSPGVLARQRYTYDDDGNLVQTWVAGDMNCDGLVNATDINLFTFAIVYGETWWNANYPNCPYLNGDINGDGLVDFGDINPFSSLMVAGNAAADQTFVWDAENRLVRVEPTTPVSGDKKVEFKYDYLGRRVQKKVWTRQSGEWVLTDVRKFVWSGWLMLLELQGGTGFQPVRKYTWGLDLAGLSGGGGSLNGGGPASSRSLASSAGPPSPASLEGAGGIGGLLAVQAPGAGPGGGNLDAVYTYDANGNVGQLVAWATGYGGAQGDEWSAGRLLAHYEYDPYGGVTAQSGAYAAANPVRFSTKYWDDETGLGYWGYRYYSPALGRWISRDPVEEATATTPRQTPVERPFVDDPGTGTDNHRYRAFANDSLYWSDPFGREVLRARKVTAAGLASGGFDNTCVVQLRCGGVQGLAYQHCQYEIASSLNGPLGECNCGPRPCVGGHWWHKCCCYDCLGCDWSTYYVKPGQGYGAVVQTRRVSEQACDCLRDKCKNWRPVACYKLVIDNSNTGAACINLPSLHGGCGLGFADPGNAPGWNWADLCTGMPGSIGGK